MSDKLKKIIEIFTSDDIDIFYKITAAIGIIIRYIALGFLCDELIKQLGITIGIIVSILTFIINFLIEKPLYKFTYLEVGIFYDTDMKSPALGSAMYSIFYIINCTALCIIQWLYDNWIYYVALLSYIITVLLIRGIVYLIRDK